MDPTDPRAALVYEAAVRTLDQQAGVVESVRVRVGILLSAAAVATSFLAGVALRGGHSLSAWGIVAVIAFFLLAVACFWLLFPRHEWTFNPNAKVLVRDYLDQTDVTLARAQRNLALFMGEASEENRIHLRTMFRWFEGACFVLGIEVLLWVAELTWGR